MKSFLYFSSLLLVEEISNKQDKSFLLLSNIDGIKLCCFL